MANNQESDWLAAAAVAARASETECRVVTFVRPMGEAGLARVRHLLFILAEPGKSFEANVSPGR